MLEELISDKNTAKVIEHFIIHEKWEQNQKDLIEELKIYPKAMKHILKKLLDLKIIVVTRKIAKSKFYKTNPDSPLVDPLRIFIQKLSFELALKEVENESEDKKIKEEIRVEKSK